MKSKLQKVRILRRIASGFTVLAAILQTVAIFVEREPNTNYFYPNATLPILAAVAAVIAALLGTAAALILPTKFFRGSVFRSRPIFYPSVVGFLLASIGLATNAKGTLGSIAAVLLFLAGIYAVLSGLPQLRLEHTSAVTALGFFAVAACILLNAYYYFDFSVEMNAPMKTSVQIAILLIMLLFTGDLRFILGIPKPKTHLVLHAWTSALGSLSAVSLPIAFLCGIDIRADYVVGAILIFAIGLTHHFQVRHLIRSSYRIYEEEEAMAAIDEPVYDSPYASPEAQQSPSEPQEPEDQQSPEDQQKEISEDEP